MKSNLKEFLLLQKEKKGNGCAYLLTAQLVLENVIEKDLDHKEADYFIRILINSRNGILMHSIKNAKKKYYAVKNGEIFNTAFFAPDYRYLKDGQFVLDIVDYLEQQQSQNAADKFLQKVEKGEKLTISHNNYNWHF